MPSSLFFCRLFLRLAAINGTDVLNDFFFLQWHYSKIVLHSCNFHLADELEISHCNVEMVARTVFLLLLTSSRDVF